MAHQQLTNLPHDPLLDLEPWVGQRQASFRFELVNGVTGQKLGTLTPIRTATLSHDTSRTMKRQLSLDLGVADSAAINPITDRVLPFMVFPNGAEYPLGRYMFTDVSPIITTSGRLSGVVLNDEMFLVDQQITAAISNPGVSAEFLIASILDSLENVTVNYTLEASGFDVSGSWSVGSNRGQILEAIAVQGDYFSPWFDNTGFMRFIRTFDPATRLPDLNWDVHNKVIRDNIVETSEILVAPNRFIVISNDAADPSIEVTATADIPATAPHSIANRGFVIAHVEDLQLSDNTQAQAVVEGIANRMTVFERVGINTPPDPRHDSYNIIRWDGANWLELAWSMPLEEGRAMSHLLRKSYA
jgi:hypothetical protein